MAKQRNDRSTREVSALGLAVRLIAPLVLVLVTYNPTGTSYFHWVRDAVAAGDLAAVHFLALAVLLIGWSVLLVATWNSLETFGVVLTAFFLGTLVWAFIDWGLLEADSADTIAWIVLVCLALVLAVGLSWAHVWRRMTGQYSVEDLDN